MKKIMIIFIAMFGLSCVSKADTVTVPTVVATLIDHVHAQVVFDSAGKTRLELTDAIFQAIPYKGGYIIEGQAGFSGDTVPQPGEPVYGRFVASGFINVAPYVKGFIVVNPNYSLLNALEFGPMYGYDFQEHHGYLGFQANLAFGLSPIK